MSLLKEDWHQFKIQNIDPLGQGICKEGEQVTFIAKTLPGEEGSLRLYKKAKGVAFGTLESPLHLTKTSDQRQTPKCPHFFNCPSCHYLHTSYQQELFWKTKTLQNLIQKLPQVEKDFPITVLPAPTREGYRNRIQLHYNIRLKKLGPIFAAKKEIIEIPHCLIPDKAIQETLKNLYQDQNWVKEAKKNSPHLNLGHLEILKGPEDGKTTLFWNKPYAQGGFSQVNEHMNKKILQIVDKWANSIFNQSPFVLDLFGGSGNLGQNLSSADILVVDNFIQFKKLKVHQTGFIADLYEESSIKLIEKKIPKENFSLMMVNPPRRGFPLLQSYAHKFSPPYLLYLSCHPQTLVRDLSNLNSQYLIQSLYLIDLFPSTYHFETLALLKRKA